MTQPRIIQSVTILGSGNVASWFAYALHQKGIEIQQIYSPNLEHAQHLAHPYQAEAICNLKQLYTKSDLYIFSVKDSAYPTLMAQLPTQIPLGVITAGTLSQQILASSCQNYGVLYPYQTISQKSDFKNLIVPLCVEGNNESTTKKLKEFADIISYKSFIISEVKRKKLHLAAVFGSNFTNAMYGISYDLMKQSDLPPTLLLPILECTLQKIQHLSPWESQTGPAKRRDTNVMQEQLQALSANPTLQEIYKLISQYIIEKTNQ